MMKWMLTGAIAGAAITVWAALAGCRTRPAEDPALARLQPETRQRMKLVMDKVGQYYLRLETSVDKAYMADAVTEAEAIATLGTYLAPQRDPQMPPNYVTLQAEFDEAARELAAAARRNAIHETSRWFDEMKATCRNCHQAFRVSLDRPYNDVAYDPKAPVKEPQSHGR